MEEFQYNEDDLQVLSQGPTPRNSRSYNKKTIKVIVLFLPSFFPFSLNLYIKITNMFIIRNNKNIIIIIIIIIIMIIITIIIKI